MTSTTASTNRALKIYLSLSQYPILSAHIRSRMRKDLFERGVISHQAFESEVREKAIRSQSLEGLSDPFSEEPVDLWEMRLQKVRDHLTDFYYAYNIPYENFESLVRDTLKERGAQTADFQISFNPELAPQNMLFEQASAIENLKPEERKKAEARLQEIKVVLIRTMISDQLGYVKIAKDWFTISDLQMIRSRKIGTGKVGGKSAGMLLAYRILQETADEDTRNSLRIPQSYYIGADLTYTFMALNGLMHWSDQKYKLEDQIRADYPVLLAEFLEGKFPPDILERLTSMLVAIGNTPLIVRSSSLLEDNFGTSFAGKYDSFFCPNQGTLGENLQDLTQAIQRIYASSLNPNALLYRRAKGLQDYDERMAILIQVVEGTQYHQYFFPDAAGVGFSRNLYRWSPKIERDAGFLRLVWGLGTRAVDRVGDDYPRLVALSHPLLHPESTFDEIKRYSQHVIDLIDIEHNQYKSLSIDQVLSTDYPLLRYMFQIDQGGYMAPIRYTPKDGMDYKYILTFDGLLNRTPLAKRMSTLLQLLEKHYHSPVDTEFTIHVKKASSRSPDIIITLLQCRPQSHLIEDNTRLPTNLSAEDTIFSTSRMAPKGRIPNISYVIYVPPEAYYALPTRLERSQLAQLIGKLNASLKGETFIFIGPGRWGTKNPDLGIPIGYADIYHARALVELAGDGIGLAPEASFGTHFFQDLVESNIYPLAIYLDDQDVVFSRDFFYNTPNRVDEFISEQPQLENIRVIKVEDYRPSHHLEIIMDDEQGRTVAFLAYDGD